MVQLLHIIGSPRSNGVSRSLSEAFLETYHQKNPDHEIHELDVWTRDLPTFSGEAANGKLKAMVGMSLPPDEQEAFNQVLEYIAQFKAADKIVVSSGMWNFGIPYRLKHYMDLIIQAGHTFGFDPNTGFYGLIKDKPLQLLLATGGDYSHAPMDAMDHHGPHLSQLFSFLGFEDIRTVTAGCTAYPPEVAGPVTQAAIEAAREAALRF